MRPASSAGRGGRPHRRGHPAKTPGPASALCPARDLREHQADTGRRRWRRGSEVSISTLEVSVRGVRSPVLTAGPPDGAEAVVFVHGNPGPAPDWRDLLSRAGEFGRAIAPDMPGHGRAGKPTAFSYSVDGYAR